MILGRTNEVIKSTLTATDAGAGAYGNSSGLLNPTQAKAFIDIIMDDSAFLKEVTFEKMNNVAGSVSLLGHAPRIMRKKIEDRDVIKGNEVLPIISEVPYRTVGVSLGTEISNDFFRQNIERGAFEEHFIRKIAEQVRRDTLDMAINGDESSLDKFESINDGWLKILKEKTPAKQQLNATTINNGYFSDQYFYDLMKALPREHYNQGNYKWICSHITKIKVMEYLRNRQTAAGDAALINGVQLTPFQIPFTTPTNFPDDILILGDPKLLKVIWTYNVGMKKTTEGRDLVSRDARFYAWFLDLDFITVFPEAFTILTNVSEILDPSPIVVRSTSNATDGISLGFEQKISELERKITELEQKSSETEPKSLETEQKSSKK